MTGDFAKSAWDFFGTAERITAGVLTPAGEHIKLPVGTFISRLIQTTFCSSRPTFKLVPDLGRHKKGSRLAPRLSIKASQHRAPLRGLPFTLAAAGLGVEPLMARCPDGHKQTTRASCLEKRLSTGPIPKMPRALRLRLEHDAEKWVPVFPRDKREAFARRSCSNKKIERDGDSTKNHLALVAAT
jgi:hypothetical protein